MNFLENLTPLDSSHLEVFLGIFWDFFSFFLNLDLNFEFGPVWYRSKPEPGRSGLTGLVNPGGLISTSKFSQETDSKLPSFCPVNLRNNFLIHLTHELQIKKRRSRARHRLVGLGEPRSSVLVGEREILSALNQTDGHAHSRTRKSGR